MNDKLEYNIKLAVKEMNEIIPVPDEYQLHNKVDTSNLIIIKLIWKHQILFWIY